MTNMYASTPRSDAYDAIIVGSGPNGLAAAITLAQAEKSVLILEAAPTIGGGLRTLPWTQPGFLHDVCASIHALAPLSPFFQQLPPDKVPLEWVLPPLPCAHPLEDGRAAVLYPSWEETAAELGADAQVYRDLFEPLVRHAGALFPAVLGPLRPPRRPLVMMNFGLRALRSAEGLARRFSGVAARALFAGMAAHSILPFDRALTGGVGLLLMLSAHAGGWPIARGGSQQVAQRLADYAESLGAEFVVNHRVVALDELPQARVVLFDVTPRTALRIVAEAWPARYRRRLAKFRHGVGVTKVDWALDGPIPWLNPRCAEAGTVHVGGTFEEIARAEAAPWRGVTAERPFVLVTQPSLFDPLRAPPGKHTAWGYCHVPASSAEATNKRIEAQVERYAPGFQKRILARRITLATDWEAYNANYVGGDITGGTMDWRQAFARPALRWTPYATPHPRLFFCSSSTPPGPGVHGMCGYHAAKAALDAMARWRLPCTRLE
jgi:phytoene dehydrogenase-like protein